MLHSSVVGLTSALAQTSQPERQQVQWIEHLADALYEDKSVYNEIQFT